MEVNKIIEDTVKQLLRRAEKEVDRNPSEAQKKAGNYTKGHITILGFDITIENPKGSYRKGVNKDGIEWKTKMNNTYGYFKNTLAVDGDHCDVFIGDNLESEKIFGIDQFLDGKFDETKFMLGFDSEDEAKKAYLSNYEKDWKGFKYIRETDIETFKKWLYNGKQKRKPFHDYVTLSENNGDLSTNIENIVKDILLSENRDENIIKIINRGSWFGNFCEKIKKYTDKFEILIDTNYEKYGITSEQYPGIGPFEYVMTDTDVSDEDKKKHDYLKFDGEYEIRCGSKTTKKTLKNILKKLGDNGNSGHSFQYKLQSIIGSKDDTLYFDGDGHDMVKFVDDELNESKNPNISKKYNNIGDLIKDKGLKIKEKFSGGSGTDGQVYLLNNGKILKYTTSEKDAGLAQQLLGKKFKHYSNVYEVGEMENGYYILSQYIPNIDTDANEKFVEKFEKKAIEYFNKTKKESDLYDNFYYLSYLLDDDFISFLKDDEMLDDKFWDITTQLKETIEELLKEKIKLSIDFNGGNFGFTNNGVLKIFDNLGEIKYSENFNESKNDFSLLVKEYQEIDFRDSLDAASVSKINAAIDIVNKRVRIPQDRANALKYLISNIDKTSIPSKDRMEIRDKVMEDLSNQVTKQLVPTMFKDGNKQKINVDNHLEELNEENKRLITHKFQIPVELFQTLLNRYNQVKGKENFTDREGYKRLQNIVNANGELGYLWIKRLKNFWDYFNGDPDKDIEAWLNGGSKMKDWVNKALENAQKSIEMSKYSSKGAGIKNAFIRTHYKDNNNININTDVITFGETGAKKGNVKINSFENVEKGMDEISNYWHADNASPEQDTFKIGVEEPINTVYKVIENTIQDIYNKSKI